MARLKFILLLILALSSAVMAEEGSNSGGGGGFMIRCEAKPLSDYSGDTAPWIRLADLWLAQTGRGPFQKTTGWLVSREALETDTIDSLLASIILRAKSVDSIYGELLEKAISEVISNTKLVTDEHIEAENDTGITSLPNGCQLIPIARFSDIDGYLTLLSDADSHLPLIDKAALVVHEAVYLLKRRFAKEPTSYNTQLDVGLLFSALDISKAHSQLAEDAYKCQRTTESIKESFIIGVSENKVKRWSLVSTHNGGTFTLWPKAIELSDSGGTIDITSEYRKSARSKNIAHFIQNRIGALYSSSILSGDLNCSPMNLEKIK